MNREQGLVESATHDVEDASGTVDAEKLKRSGSRWIFWCSLVFLVCVNGMLMHTLKIDIASPIIKYTNISSMIVVGVAYMVSNFGWKTSKQSKMKLVRIICYFAGLVAFINFGGF